MTTDNFAICLYHDLYVRKLYEHFAIIGTLLASGSDDLKVVILDWIRSKTYISFDSGHRANVFQVFLLQFIYISVID